MMALAILLSVLAILIGLPNETASFSTVSSRVTLKLQSFAWQSHLILHSNLHKEDTNNVDDSPNQQLDGAHHNIAHTTSTRRTILQQSLLATSTAALSLATSSQKANAALGTLPEFADANAILQSITIDVSDQPQYDETIAFFTNGFDGMKVLRQRNNKASGGAVKDTWLGFGPEQLSSIPSNFILPVSSLNEYGGHASIHIRYDPSSTKVLYRRSNGEINNEPASGNNIAYLQFGVPQYRISQMVQNGGNVIDAYGWVNAVSPCGLPIRAIVGIRPDPIMFLALNCVNVEESAAFYNKLGFVPQEYPYARLNQGQGQFEPPQPAKSVYLAPSPNSMGILLLQNEKRKKGVVPNPVVRSVNVVYAPPEGSSSDSDASNSNGGASDLEPQLKDPSSLPISFIPQELLEKEIKMTAVPQG